MINFKTDGEKFHLVLQGLVFQFLDALSFCFKNTNLSKLISDKFARFGTKINPAVLNSRSQAAEEVSALLYSLYETCELVLLFL